MKGYSPKTYLNQKIMKSSMIESVELLYAEQLSKKTKTKKKNYDVFKNFKGKIKKLHQEEDRLFHSGKYYESIDICEQILKIDPKDSYAWHNKACCFMCLNEPEKAFECFDKAIEIEPKNTSALFMKGNLLFKLGDFVEALKYFDLALKYEKNGIIYEEIKKLKEKAMLKVNVDEKLDYFYNKKK